MLLEQYEHHGRMVHVRSDLKGLHRDHCLCYSCKRFKPDKKENCRIAKEVYALCVREDLVLPVWECPLFEVVSGGFIILNQAALDALPPGESDED